MERNSSRMAASQALDEAVSLPVIERALLARQALDFLHSALHCLDAIGADIAGAHTARAIDVLAIQFELNTHCSESDQPACPPAGLA